MEKERERESAKDKRMKKYDKYIYWRRLHDAEFSLFCLIVSNLEFRNAMADSWQDKNIILLSIAAQSLATILVIFSSVEKMLIEPQMLSHYDLELTAKLR